MSTSSARLHLVDTSTDAARIGRRRVSTTRRPLGDVLLRMGVLTPADLTRALALQNREDLRLGDILIAHGMITPNQLTRALAQQFDAQPIDLETLTPDPRLIDELGVETCLKLGVLPVRRMGGATVIATCRPEAFDDVRPSLPSGFGEPILALCDERALHRALVRARNRRLVVKAETRVAEHESCRYWYDARPRQVLVGVALFICVSAVLAPLTTLAALTVWCLITLTACTGLKAFAALTHARRPPPPEAPQTQVARLPVVSVMVPLFREEDIAPRLIKRLERLNYPKELLDICLVIEEDDDMTAQMIRTTRLPSWMRDITVPVGGLKTKPRALNFALDFCRGSIIGIYDAEDMPDPDQIHRIVRRFHERPAHVACLQGVLDYYNTRRNWFTRCFTAEYAGWFRVVLPGIADLGLAVPLGGTTCFFRREPLEKLGAWDAHNVTEDADLGVRLARHGYETEVIDTVTQEEANGRLVPWVKQRSRWLKGFAMTYAVHMRDPGALLRDFGWRRFMGFQIMFLGILSQFMLAPLMWSFWLILAGAGHPLQALLPSGVIWGMSAMFITAELTNIAIGMAGAHKAGKPHVLPWVPSMHFYYPLAAFAMYKAAYEMVSKPFYWDKTQHGIADEMDEPETTL
ncbi:family 2 glycosyl transferase [Actibacterium atlanticum]|uniref:Family 2 glycosyl transferase n=1 Tax=Actibacterium atlanticum TaxID=1461693 RepID=A0A058ZR42_9RHOB|nr:glycosyltransferase family 2 protein [Actibacterium atlanticum]KCV83296.1 family 2 glycosyl transferase [Actibacterium atlanticum]